MKVTRDIFERYLEIQMSGEYNMFMEAGKVAELLGVDMKTYSEILRNYSTYKEIYGF